MTEFIGSATRKTSLRNSWRTLITNSGRTSRKIQLVSNSPSIISSSTLCVNPKIPISSNSLSIQTNQKLTQHNHRNSCRTHMQGQGMLASVLPLTYENCNREPPSHYRVAVALLSLKGCKEQYNVMWNCIKQEQTRINKR